MNTKVPKIQLQQRSTLTPQQFEALLKELKISNRHVYEGAELQMIEAAIARQSAPQIESDPTAANSALTQIAQGIVSGIANEMQEFRSGLMQIKEDTSDYLSDELVATPRDIAAMTVTKVQEKLKANPISLAGATRAAFRVFSLPEATQPSLPTLPAGSDVV